MDMQASRQLAVTQQQAWDALNDPEVLKRCIAGCDRVEATAPQQYAVGVALRIGPVSAKFSGKIDLSELDPPNSYTLSFEGKGGPAGFGKGDARVKLIANETGCLLDYTVHAQVGGKVAQLGQRLVDGAAKSMAEDFFKRFDEEMQRRHPAAPGAPEAPAAVPAKTGLAGVPAWVWIAGALALVAVWWLSRQT
ncbi:MAG: carbon monoxide dehydrogenase [Betaproteobacteria bacterium]|nr:carbon monoxide dehydrogenase [Betaproteobacteria bacterium]